MNGLLTALLAASLAGSALGADPSTGCGLPAVHATAGGTLYVRPLQTAALRMVAWRDGSDAATPVKLELPGRFLPAQAGSGDVAWVASVDDEHVVHAFRLTPAGGLVAEGTIRSAGQPAAFSWCRDRAGAAWILLSTIDRDERRIEAFRRERSRWVARGSVRADDLRTPRPLAEPRSSILCGGWRFSASRLPQRIPVSGNRDLAEIFPHPDGLTELRLDDLRVLTSADGGAHWNEHAPPWAKGIQFEFRPEAIDLGGEAPMIRWVASGQVHVARFERGKWTTVLEVPAEQVRQLSGPAVMADGALVFLGICYRTAAGSPDSFDAAVIRDGRVRRLTVAVSR